MSRLALIIKQGVCVVALIAASNLNLLAVQNRTVRPKSKQKVSSYEIVEKLKRATQTWAKQKNGEWQVVSTQVMALSNERKPAVIDSKNLDAYIGQYELAPEVTYTITREGDKLIGQRTGRAKEELLPLCVDIFYRKGTWRGEKGFQRDGQGRIVAMLDRRENNDLILKKIK